MFALQFGGEFETLMDNSLTKGVGSPRHARPSQPRLSLSPSLPLPSHVPPSSAPSRLPPRALTHTHIFSLAVSHTSGFIDSC